MLSTRRHRKRDLVVAMIVARVLEPRSKLATARALDEETLSSSLAEELGVGSASADELYEAMDWLVGGQERIEKKLAARHLTDGGRVMWDVSSTYFEGRKCELAAHGYSRDRRGDRPQIVFGLLTTPEGCPVAVEVFPGNTADPGTVGTAVERLTERFGLEEIAAATRRQKRPLRGEDRIGVRVGRVLQNYKVGKHFDYEITDSSFTYRRNEERIAEEAALDGIYVVRTSLAADEIGAGEAVAAYKRLSEVERAFRAYEGVDLEVRPIHHWRADWVRAHVFLCTLAYYVEWHMRGRPAPLLSGENGDGDHSFPTLLSDLATLTKNTVRVGEHITFEQISRPTGLQSRALDLLDVQPRL